MPDLQRWNAARGHGSAHPLQLRAFERGRGLLARPGPACLVVAMPPLFLAPSWNFSGRVVLVSFRRQSTPLAVASEREGRHQGRPSAE